MRLHEDINFTTLAWVKPELDETLRLARRSLEDYVEDESDSGPMRYFATYLHQVHGSLRMVELYGAAMVAEEMERLANALADGEVGDREEAFTVLMRGIVQLPDYLERIQAGFRDIPLVLVPLLNELRSVRGSEQVGESALFAPDLLRPLPASAAGPARPLPETTVRQHAEALRQRYQSALLSWLRDERNPIHPTALAGVCAKLAELLSVEAGRRLFWVTSGVLEGLRDQALVSSTALKQTLGRVEREIKRLVDQGERGFVAEPPQEPTRQLLYFVAHAGTGHARLDELRRVFDLDAYLPDARAIEHAQGSMSGHNRALLATVTSAIKDDLLRVKDALDLHMRNIDAPAHALTEQIPVLGGVGDTLSMLGLAMPRRVVLEQRDALQDLLDGRRAMDESALLDIAGALLYVEASLDDQVQRLGQGDPDIADEGDPQALRLPESEARQVLESLVREAAANFAKARQCFVAFVETGWDHAQLADVAHLLGEVAGALRMLQIADAPEHLDAVARFTRLQLIARKAVPSGEQLDTLADALAGLEYFLEALGERRGGRERILELTRSSLERLGADRLTEPEPEIASLEPATPEFVLSEPEAPAVSTPPEAPALAAVVSEVSPDESPSEPISSEPAAAASSAPSVEPVSGQLAAELAPDLSGFEAAGDEIDDEIREVFLEEVQEEIENLDRLLIQWRQSPEDLTQLRSIRRVFHTLKGSGRLVGAMTLGEFAWRIENALNRVLDGTRHATDAVQALVARAREALPGLQGMLAGQQVDLGPVEALKTLADRVAAGEDPTLSEFSRAFTGGSDVGAAEPLLPEPSAERQDLDLDAALSDGPSPFHGGGVPVAIDPVLLEVLLAEVGGHLTTLREWLERCLRTPQPAGDPLLRAVHTINGAFAMAEVPMIPEVTTPLESYVRRLMASGRPASRDGVALFGEAVAALDEVVRALERPMPSLSGFGDLPERLDALRDSLPEARLPIPSGAEVDDADADEDVGADERDEGFWPEISMPEEPDLSLLEDRGGQDSASSDAAPPDISVEAPREADSSADAGSPPIPESDQGAWPEFEAGTGIGFDAGQSVDPSLEIGDQLEFIGEVSEDALPDWLREPNPEIGHQAPSDDTPALETNLGDAVPVESEHAREIAEAAADRAEAPVGADGSNAADAPEDAQTIYSPEELAELEAILGAEIEQGALAVPLGEFAPGEFDVRSSPERGGEHEVPDIDVLPPEAAESGGLAQSESPGRQAQGTDIGEVPTPESEDDWLASALESLPTDIGIEAAEWLSAPVEIDQGASPSADGDGEADAPAMTAELQDAFEPRSVDAAEGVPSDALPDEASSVGGDAPVLEIVAPADAESAPVTETRADGEALDISWFAADPDPDLPLDTADLDIDLLDIFVEESRDLLDSADRLVARLREAPGEHELVTALQRDLHTLKGGARMAGVMAMGELGHVMESLLETVADGRRELDRTGARLLEVGLDRLHAMAERAAARRAMAMPTALIERIAALAGGQGYTRLDQVEAAATAVLPGAPDPSAPVASPAEPGPEQARDGRQPHVEPVRPLSKPIAAEDLAFEDEPGSVRAPQEQVRIRADLLDRLVNYAGEVAIYRSRLEQQLGGFRGNLNEFEQTNIRLREQLRKLEIETEAQIIARYQRESDARDPEFDPLELDRFSTLQQLSRALAESATDLSSLQTTLEDLTRQYEALLLQQSRVSTDLQEGLMRTRMVPFESLVPRLRRVLRQAGTELGKHVQLRVEGAQGEMDRSVLDRMIAPLEHMLRNAVAHGLETPAERKKAGKPQDGTVSLSVSREGSEVVIAVADDGRGLDAEAIRRKAIERGRLDADAVVSDSELYRFILDTGFSTAASVSRLAGRGVGMDVVHNEIRQLGGLLLIESTHGAGTRFIVRLPFSLAVTQAVFVQIGESTHAVPIASVKGVGRIDREDLNRRIAEGEAVYEYAGERYEIHDLGRLLGQPSARAAESLQMPLLLVQSGDLRAAVLIDHVLGNREIVVKPVGPQISSIPGVFGATIMGDGSVVVILDIPPLVRHHATKAQAERPAVAVVETRARTVPLVMVVDDSITMRKVTGRVLERHNIEVVTAKDGLDAIEKMAERVPDLILLDVEMPRMDGYELATHVRADNRLQHVPIVMITSRTGEKHRQRALSLGVDAYLGKPYQEADLMRQVRELLPRAAHD